MFGTARAFRIALAHSPADAAAMVGLAADDEDQALTWLERAFGERHKDLIFLRVDPQWDPIRADPRFEALAQRVKIPRL